MTTFLHHVRPEVFTLFVEHHPLATFMQTAQWARLKTLHGGRVFTVGVEQDGGLYAASILLSLEFRKVDRTFLYAPRGFLAHYHRDESILASLTDGVRELAEDLGAVFVRIDPNLRYRSLDLEGNYVPDGEDNSWLLEKLAEHDFHHTGFEPGVHRIQPRHVMWLDLDADLDDIFARFHKKTRYNIRLAERRGVEVAPGTRADLGRFSELMAATAARDDFKPRTLAYFEELHDTVLQVGGGQLFLARCRGEVIAGAIAMRSRREVCFLYGASDESHRERMPNHLLQWQMIRWAKKRGATRYDFRGSGRPTEESSLHGLYRFKRGFGGEYVELVGEFDHVLDRGAYDELMTKGTELGRKQRKLFRGLSN